MNGKFIPGLLKCLFQNLLILGAFQEFSWEILRIIEKITELQRQFPTQHQNNTEKNKRVIPPPNLGGKTGSPSCFFRY